MRRVGFRRVANKWTDNYCVTVVTRAGCKGAVALSVCCETSLFRFRPRRCWSVSQFRLQVKSLLSLSLNPEIGPSQVPVCQAPFLSHFIAEPHAKILKEGSDIREAIYCMIYSGPRKEAPLAYPGQLISPLALRYITAGWANRQIDIPRRNGTHPLAMRNKTLRRPQSRNAPPASRSVSTTMDTDSRAPKTVEHVLACHTSYIMGGH